MSIIICKNCNAQIDTDYEELIDDVCHLCCMELTEEDNLNKKQL